MASSPDHVHNRYDVESGLSEGATPQSFYRWLMSWVEHPDDDTPQRTRKRILFPLVLVICSASIAVGVLSLIATNWYNALFMSGVRVVLSLCFISFVVHTKTCPVGVAEFFIISIGMTLFLFDDILSFGKNDSWTGAVLVMDVLLLTCCRDTTAAFTCAAILLYITVKTTEEGFRFGLYDIVPSSYNPDSSPREAQDSYWFIRVLIIRFLTFFGDFVMTRNFAHGMRSEQQKSEEDVNMANRVAASLVKFDLDAAEHHLLRGQKGGSSELQEAFLSLIANLKLYKPYLPDALFSHLSDSTTDLHSMEEDEVCALLKHYPVRQTPPGTGGEGSVTIAFTDIQSSTDIWEKHTTAMRTAMDLHNQAMRECIYRTNGYEVKTIGDAFMVAFDAVEDAVRFSLMAQEELVAQPWPSSLLEHPLCKACGGAWKGLRVRIGVHTGPARLEVNPTTGRTDYMGPTVNKTARVEAVSVGGAVAVTEEVLEKLEQVGGLQDVGNPATLKIGHQLLKGVGSVPIVLLVPTKLKQRVGDLERAAEEKRKHVTSDQSSSQATLKRQGTTPQHGKGITKNKLTQAVGTMGTTRIEFSEIPKFGSVVDAVGEVLGVVLDGVNRTDGVVTALCSGTVLVGWNTSKQCVMHAAQSAKFVSNVHVALEGSGWAGQVTVGLCGGRVLHGMMGNTKQRFMTTIGGCVEVSRALADAAASFGTCCLIVGGDSRTMSLEGSTRRGSCILPMESNDKSAVLDTSLQVHTRPIDTWDGMTVYQLNLQTFALVQGVWNIFDGPVPDSWSPLYKDAFASRNIAALKTLSEKDPSLLKVVAILQGDLSLPRPFTTQKIDTLLTTPDGWVVKETGGDLSLSLSGGFELPELTWPRRQSGSPL